MVSKRGQLILIVALEIVAAVFASFLLFKLSFGWASGDASDKLYYTKDLALLTDVMFTAPGVTVFNYPDNVSGFDISFKGNAVGLASGLFDPSMVIYYFVPFKDSSVNSVLSKPNLTVIFTRSGPNLSIGLDEDKVLSVFSKSMLDVLTFDDVKISDKKDIFVSGSSPLVKSKFFPELRQVLGSGFTIQDSKPTKSEGVLLIFDKSVSSNSLNIFYPVGSDSLINKKNRKLAVLLFNGVKDDFKVSLNPSSPELIGFVDGQVGLVIDVNDDLVSKSSVFYSSLVNAFDGYFGGAK